MNTIREVFDGNNDIHTTPSAMGYAFVRHFSSIFRSTIDYDEGGIFYMLDAIKSFISDEDKIMLTAAYTCDEVNATLDMMYLDKTPKPDGMTAFLLQETLAFYW